MGFDVQIDETRAGAEVYRLIDTDDGSSASILPSVGFNLFELRLLLAGGEIHSVVAAADGWAERPEHPTRNGMPILFPFPNRIREAEFEFDGRTYHLNANKPPHAIHGFAFDAPFDVTEAGTDARGAFVTGRFQVSRQAPQHFGRWPGDPVLELTYRLKQSTLTVCARISNASSERMPWGFGIHSYFRFNGDRSKMRVFIPATQYWVLESSLPTGMRQPVNERLDFRHTKAIGGESYDDLLTGLRRESDTWSTSGVADDPTGVHVRLRCDASFREMVVFTPPWFPDAIAIEPYTCATDAVHLQAGDVDAGLHVLEPGRGETLRLTISGT